MTITAWLLHLKKRTGFFKSQPAAYIGVIFGAIVASYVYKFRTETIFACTAKDYSSDRYVGYCGGTNYADYEHGAFQFGLEPAAYDFAKKADVLFIGNSYLQVAFSTAATANWFSAASARYYLLGFNSGENVVFEGELLRKIHPQGKV